MRIEVDPEALIAAGRQMASLGSQLGRLSDALGAALSGGIASGTDPAGLNFGMKYGRQAQDFAEAVAEAADAFTTVGLLVEATGINYRNADAASTIGGSGPGAGVSGQPGKTMPAHVPPGPNGVTVPAPSKWHLVQPFLQALPVFGLLAGTAMTWPSGHSAMMGITAMQWRNFATGFALIEPQLGGIRSVVGAQSIPESGAMVAAIDDLGAAISSLTDVASTMAQSVSDFAATVQATQDAIRRLLDRLSISGLWDTVTGLLTGEGDDILREVARDIGAVLENFQQQVKGVVGLLDELTILIGDAATAFQKWIRPVLVEHFGDGVGNALADAVTLYTDIQVGAATGLIGIVAGAVALADPDTWKGMAELAASVVQDPSSAPGVLANMGKEFLAWDKWSGEHPGRAAGEAAFNIGSLVVPGGALAKSGSIAKGLNLSRRMLDEGRLPELGEVGDWAQVPGGAPRVPEVPPVRPGAPVGAGQGRVGEAPPGGRSSTPTPGAEGGSGQRVPVEPPGRGDGQGETGGPRAQGPADSAPPGATGTNVSEEVATDTYTKPPGESEHADGSIRNDGNPNGGPPRSEDSAGDGWRRIPDTPGDPSYGQPLAEHWDSGQYPTPDVTSRSTFDLVQHPDEPYGHDADGNPLTKDEYDARYNLIGPEGEHWENYPPNDGALPGTRVVYDSGEAFVRDYGPFMDRIGSEAGRYLGVMPDGIAPAFESRSLPISSLNQPYNAYNFVSLPEGWSIEVSQIAPAFGRDGGSLQVLVYNESGQKMSIRDLLRSDVIE